MMVTAFVLDLYIAAVLGVSGLTKVKEPAEFAATLYRHRILPSWSIPGISYALPRGEVVLAGALVAGLAPLFTAALALVLLGGFFMVETMLLITARATECGCYGAGYTRRVDGASVLTSAALVGLAILHLWAVRVGAPVIWTWRLPAVALFVGADYWLLWRALHRRKGLARLMSA